MTWASGRTRTAQVVKSRAHVFIWVALWVHGCVDRQGVAGTNLAPICLLAQTLARVAPTAHPLTLIWRIRLMSCRRSANRLFCSMCFTIGISWYSCKHAWAQTGHCFTHGHASRLAPKYPSMHAAITASQQKSQQFSGNLTGWSGSEASHQQSCTATSASNITTLRTLSTDTNSRRCAGVSCT